MAMKQLAVVVLSLCLTTYKKYLPRQATVHVMSAKTWSWPNVSLEWQSAKLVQKVVNDGIV